MTRPDEKRPSSAFTAIDFDKPGKQIGHVMIPHSPDDDAWGVTRVPMAVIANGRGPTVILEVGCPLRLYAEGQIAELPLIQGDDMLANEHDHFLDCLRDRRTEPVLTLRDALDGLKLADAILDSLRLGREVRL